MLKRLVLAAAAVAFVGWATTASAAPPVGNHMSCYQIKDLKIPAKFNNSGIYSVFDQVSGQLVTKCKPKLLCTPASKDGSLIIDASLHYLCYQCKGSFAPVINYGVTDQFGTLTVQTKKLKFLCNPTEKF